MITITDVHKRYWLRNGEPHWVLRNVNLRFPADRNTGVIGVNGAGKSTLLRMLAGIDRPTRGEITVESRVSWPIGLTRGLQPMLTGRQNARFICRIHGFEEELDERVEFVRSFSELGDLFDEPVWTYSSGMRARLNFSLSMAFEFDMYLVDEVMAVGDAGFRQKSERAIKERAERAGMVIVSHNVNIVTSMCHSAVWVHKGGARWFDSTADAVEAYGQYQEAHAAAQRAQAA